MPRARLIPTEATPVPSRTATPEPVSKAATSSKPSKASAADTATTSTLASASATVSREKTIKARPSQVANGFIALPVALPSSIPGLQSVIQHIYLRRKAEDSAAPPDAGGVESIFEDTVQESTSLDAFSSSSKGTTLFAVNLPFGSTEDHIKQGIEALIRARSGSSKDGDTTSSSTAKAKGKGRANDLPIDSMTVVVESVELVQPSVSHRINNSVIETEGIVHPSSLLKKQEILDLSKMQNLSKKQKKALQAQLQQQQQEQEQQESGNPLQASKNRIHPLFVSTDITTQEALNHLFPTSSTLKAHITLSSSRWVQMLLNEKPTASWTMTHWPSTTWSFEMMSKDGKKQAKTRDEILFDLARPAAESVKLHVDDWMKVFDEANPHRIALARRAAELAAEEASQPKSKRAQAREAAAKAAKQAEYARKKAIKKRRIYDDDFDEPEADEDGWVTVTAGGVKGRSAGAAAGGGGLEEDNDDQFEDEEEMRQAELEGFVSGKRSVGIAKKSFIKEKEREIALERKKALLELNSKLGINTGSHQDDDDAIKSMSIGDDDDEDEDISRGGGRGRKKKMKKSRGIEVNMYGFHRREENKKTMSNLRLRFEEDKKKIAEMKAQKRFRPY